MASDILKEENERLRQMLRSAFPEKSGNLFICGVTPSTDGLPPFVTICAAYGSDLVAVYERKGVFKPTGDEVTDEES